MLSQANAFGCSSCQHRRKEDPSFHEEKLVCRGPAEATGPRLCWSLPGATLACCQKTAPSPRNNVLLEAQFVVLCHRGKNEIVPAGLSVNSCYVSVSKKMLDQWVWYWKPKYMPSKLWEDVYLGKAIDTMNCAG